MPSSGCQTCALDRKSTRLNSSHTLISYAVFCLKKNMAMIILRLVTTRLSILTKQLPLKRTTWENGCSEYGCLTMAAQPTFFFKDTAPTEIYPFSLHAALPI